ncbi:MAG: hypothetical protein WDW38_004801 [Sanguina aurantia]
MVNSDHVHVVRASNDAEPEQTDGDEPVSVLDLLRGFQQVQSMRAQHYATFHTAFKDFLVTRQEGPHQRLMAQLSGAFGACSQRVRAIESVLSIRHDRGDLARLLDTLQGLEREKLRLTLALQALRQAHAFHTFSWQGSDVDVLMTPAERLSQAIDAAQARVCGCSSHTAHAHAPSPSPSPAAGDAPTPTAADPHPHSHGAGDGHQHSHAPSGVQSGSGVLSDGHERPPTAVGAAATAVAAGGAEGLGARVAAGGERDESSGVLSASQAGVHVHAGPGVAMSEAAAAAVPEATEAEFNAAMAEAVQHLDCVVGAINEVLDELACAIEELADAE